MAKAIISIGGESIELGGGSGGGGMDLLWENASPTSAFNPQTLSLNDLSVYNYIVVIALANLGGYPQGSLLIPKNIQSCFLL